MHEAVVCVYVSLTRKDLITFLTVAESSMNVCCKREYKENRMQEKTLLGKPMHGRKRKNK